MGVLKAKVAGNWVNIGAGGGSPLPGGVLGDIMVKQSSTANDVTWATAMPKLHLTSPNAVTLVSTDHPLTLGTIAGTNLGLYSTGIQARNNGVIAALRLNYYGGDVLIGGNQAVTVTIGGSGTGPHRLYVGDDAYFTDVNVANTMGLVSATDATQGNLKMGGATFRGLPTYYQLSAPAAGNAYYDANVHYFRNAAGSDYLNIQANAINFQAGGGWNMIDSTWVRTVGAKNIYTSAEIRCGGPYSFDAGHKIDTSGGEMRLWATSALTHFANTHQWLNAAANAWHMKYDGSTLINYNSGFQFSGTGYKLTHSTDTDTGVYYWSDGAIGFVANGSTPIRTAGTGLDILAMNPGSQFRLAGPSDANHGIEFSNGTPSGSGEASNGPLYRAWSGHWWYQNGTGYNMYFASSGNLFLAAGRSFTTFSSIEFKDHVEILDPEDCLDHIRRWRPVEYDIKPDPEFPDRAPCHSEGFISEEHVNITPTMVNVCGENSQRPGWANAINYAGGVPRLAGAIQALAARIEQLEGRAA